MQRILVDLKAPEGREAFLRLARARRRADRELPPRRRRPPRHRLRRGLGRATRASCTAPPAATGRTAPTRSGRATTSTTSPSAASCTAPARGADGQPPVPGAHGRRQRRRRHARGDGDPRRARAARHDRRGRVPRRVGRPTACSALMALAVDEYLATGERAGPAAPASSPVATPVTTPTRAARRRLAVGRRDRAAVLGQPLPAARARPVGRAPDRRRRAGRDPRRPRARRSSTRDRDDWVAVLSPADTCVAPVLSVPEVVARRAVPRARRVRRRARIRSTAPSDRSGRCSRARSGPTEPYVRARRDRHRHRRVARAPPGFAADEIAKLRDAGVVA